MKILIFGGDGMLGHQLLASFRDRHDVRVTLRQPLAAYAAHGLFSAANSVDQVDVLDAASVRNAFDRTAPDAVVNCVGIIKQRSAAKAAIPSITINALWPNQLLEMCRAGGAQLIHLSTDCVFSGRQGSYRETDLPDPVDLYGRSKLLGEVSDAPGLTVRTSIIGLELSRNAGLIEWFLAQRGIIRGFRRAIFTGLTTTELARTIERLIVDHPRMHGVWHVASAPINKYDLLSGLARRLGRSDIEIVPDDALVCDRSLRADAFAAETGYTAPAWETMLNELADSILAREARAPRSGSLR